MTLIITSSASAIEFNKLIIKTVEPASETQRNQVQTALGNQYPISKIVTIKSSNHPNAYYIGAIFYAEGCGNLIGIWLGGNKDTWGLLFSVDGTAHQFSGMCKASKTKAEAHIWDPEAKTLRKYLNNRGGK